MEVDGELFSIPQLSEVRNANSNLIPIGKTTPENDQEDYEPDAEDDDADNAEEESEGKGLTWMTVWHLIPRSRSLSSCNI